MRRFLAVLGAEVRITFRNRQRITIGFGSPILLMLLIGWAFGSGQPLSVPIGIVDRDDSQTSVRLVQQMRSHKVAGVTVHTGGLDGELAKLKRGDRRLVLVIPPGFEATSFGFETSLVVYEDPSDPQNARLALTVLQSVLAEAQARTGIDLPLTIERREIAGGLRFTYLDFLAPGLLGMGAMNIALMGAVGALVQYRESGLLRRIRVTPLPLATFIAGSSAVSLLLALIQVFLLLGVAVTVFKVKIAGSWLTLTLIVLVGNAAFVNLGIIVSSIANTFQSALVIATAMVVPMIFLSGTFFQTETMPRFLQPVIQILPLTHLVDALREVALRGAPLVQVAPRIAALVALGVVMFVVALRMFRWE